MVGIVPIKVQFRVQRAEAEELAGSARDTENLRVTAVMGGATVCSEAYPDQHDDRPSNHDEGIRHQRSPDLRELRMFPKRPAATAGVLPGGPISPAFANSGWASYGATSTDSSMRCSQPRLEARRGIVVTRCPARRQPP